MNQKPTEPKNAQDQDAVVDAAWQRLAGNKDDDIENSFCYQLFEERRFDEQLFVALCDDMDVVLEQSHSPKESCKLLVWIISCTFRSVFSHHDKSDLYRIDNFDADMSAKWGGEYLERMRDLLDKIVNVAID